MDSDNGWPGYGSNNSETQFPAVLEALPADPATPKQKYIRLGTIRQIRFELAAIYREVRTGKLASGEGTRLAWLLQALANLTVDSQLEQRIAELEKGRE